MSAAHDLSSLSVLDLMLRVFACVVGLVVGYVVGAVVGYATVEQLSSNGFDRSVEAATTAAFVYGPAGAIVGAILGAIIGRKRRGKSR